MWLGGPSCGLADASCGCVEVSVDQNTADAQAMLSVRVAGLCHNWTACYFQKAGYSSRNYGTWENRYSALAIDSIARVRVRLSLHRAQAM
jgi:hypothetical protein